MNEEEVGIAINWIRKSMEYDVENMITYHGGLFKDNPNQRIKELL